MTLRTDLKQFWEDAVLSEKLYLIFVSVVFFCISAMIWNEEMAVSSKWGYQGLIIGVTIIFGGLIFMLVHLFTELYNEQH